MRNSLETLALPSSTARLSSQSPSPAPRNPSRSPHPYRRKNPSRKRRTSASSPNDTQSSQNSSPGTPLQGISYSGEAESGTEADDELTRRLTAPPGRRRRLSDDDVFGAVGTEGNGWVGRKEVGISKKPGGRLYAAIARRIIEVTLAMILAVLVSKGKNGKYWEASMQQRGKRNVLIP